MQDLPKNRGVVSKQVPSKSPHPAAAADAVLNPQVLQDWESRDKKTQPFSNFMLIVINDQIDRRASEKSVASDLGLDHKTYGLWRSSLSSASSLQEIIESIKSDPSLIADKYIGKLKTVLEAQVAKISRASSPSGRSHAGMPNAKIFNKAVSHAEKTVFIRYAMSKYFLSKAKATAEAKRMTNDLVWAYSYKPARRLEDAWEVLLKKINDLSSQKNEECLLKATSQYEFDYGPDHVNESRFRKLQTRVDSLKSQAESLAMNYVKLLEKTTLQEDEWSDKSMPQFPAPQPIKLDPQFSEYRLNQLKALISKISSM